MPRPKRDGAIVKRRSRTGCWKVNPCPLPSYTLTFYTGHVKRAKSNGDYARSGCNVNGSNSCTVERRSRIARTANDRASHVTTASDSTGADARSVSPKTQSREHRLLRQAALTCPLSPLGMTHCHGFHLPQRHQYRRPPQINMLVPHRGTLLLDQDQLLLTPS